MGPAGMLSAALYGRGGGDGGRDSCSSCGLSWPAGGAVPRRGAVAKGFGETCGGKWRRARAGAAA